MLSARFIQTIERHWEGITETVIRQIRSDANLFELGKLPESELRERGREILSHLESQLTADRTELFRKQELAGRRRFDESVPLHEVVYALQMFKQKTIDYVRHECGGTTTLELYAEEEFEYNLNRLFDEIIYFVVKGYERAMRESSLTARIAARSR